MIYCKYIANLYNKKIHKCNSEHIYNKFNYIDSLISSQEPETIYLYKFNDGTRYLSVFNKIDGNFVSEINDPIFLKFLWEFYGVKKNAHQHKLSIIKNIKIINDFNKNNKINIDDDKIYNFLGTFQHKSNDHAFCNSLENNDLIQKIINNQYFSQKGAGVISDTWEWTKWIIGWYVFPIYSIEQYIYKNYPGWISNIVYWGLEIIDFLFSIVGILVVLIPPPVGIIASFVFDVFNLVYNVTRFDILGVIVSILGLFPYVGDVLTGVGSIAKPFLKVGAKLLFKSIGKALGIGAKTSKTLVNVGSKLVKVGKMSKPVVNALSKPVIKNARTLIDKHGQIYGQRTKELLYGPEEYTYNDPNINNSSKHIPIEQSQYHNQPIPLNSDDSDDIPKEPHIPVEQSQQNNQAIPLNSDDYNDIPKEPHIRYIPVEQSQQHTQPIPLNSESNDI